MKTIWTLQVTAFQDPHEKLREFVKLHKIVFDYYKICPHTGGYTIEIVKNSPEYFHV